MTAGGAPENPMKSLAALQARADELGRERENLKRLLVECAAARTAAEARAERAERALRQIAESRANNPPHDTWNGTPYEWARRVARAVLAAGKQPTLEEPPLCEKCGERHYHRTQSPPTLAEPETSGSDSLAPRGAHDSGSASAAAGQIATALRTQADRLVAGEFVTGLEQINLLYEAAAALEEPRDESGYPGLQGIPGRAAAGQEAPPHPWSATNLAARAAEQPCGLCGILRRYAGNPEYCGEYYGEPGCWLAAAEDQQPPAGQEAP